MHRVAVTAGLILVLVTTVTPAFAQDDPRFALVASFPSPTVSVQWEMNERFAIRVDGSFTYRDQSTDEITSSTSFSLNGATTTLEERTQVESSSRTTSIGVAGIVTVRRDEHLRLYLAPRVLFGFTDQETTLTSSTSGTLPLGVIFTTPPRANLGPVTQESSYTSKGAGISFGASSKVFDRVALFGEIGTTFTSSNAPTLPTIVGSISVRSEANSKTTTLSSRAVAGVMFLF